MPPFREAFFIDLYFTLGDDSKPFDNRSVLHINLFSGPCLLIQACYTLAFPVLYKAY
jgi:hypothetical protein